MSDFLKAELEARWYKLGEVHRVIGGVIESLQGVGDPIYGLQGLTEAINKLGSVNSTLDRLYYDELRVAKSQDPEGDYSDQVGSLSAKYTPLVLLQHEEPAPSSSIFGSFGNPVTPTTITPVPTTPITGDSDAEG